MPKPIMNLDAVAFDDVEENGPYTSSRGSIGRHIGAKKLGYNLTVLPPGGNPGSDTVWLGGANSPSQAGDPRHDKPSLTPIGLTSES